MSRIKVSGDYDPAGNYVLSYTEGEQIGEIYKSISPNDVFGIGNSIGGYWAKPITYAGQPMLALIRLGGSEKHLSQEEIRKRKKDEKGLVLKPMIGLWAVSSGSARNGIFHRWNPPTDEIETALDKCGYGRKCLHRVNSIEGVEVNEGGQLCHHQTGNGSGYVAQYDGKVVETTTEPTYVELHMNQHHIGCGESAGTYLINGGTFLLQWYIYQAMNGSWKRSLTAIYITPRADTHLVVGLIEAGPFKSVSSVQHELADEQVA